LRRPWTSTAADDLRRCHETSAVETTARSAFMRETFRVHPCWPDCCAAKTRPPARAVPVEGAQQLRTGREIASVGRRLRTGGPPRSPRFRPAQGPPVYALRPNGTGGGRERVRQGRPEAPRPAEEEQAEETPTRDDDERGPAVPWPEDDPQDPWPRAPPCTSQDGQGPGGAQAPSGRAARAAGTRPQGRTGETAKETAQEVDRDPRGGDSPLGCGCPRPIDHEDQHAGTQFEHTNRKNLADRMQGVPIGGGAKALGLRSEGPARRSGGKGPAHFAALRGARHGTFLFYPIFQLIGVIMGAWVTWVVRIFRRWRTAMTPSPRLRGQGLHRRWAGLPTTAGMPGSVGRDGRGVPHYRPAAGRGCPPREGRPRADCPAKASLTELCWSGERGSTTGAGHPAAQTRRDPRAGLPGGSSSGFRGGRSPTGERGRPWRSGYRYRRIGQGSPPGGGGPAACVVGLKEPRHGPRLDEGACTRFAHFPGPPWGAALGAGTSGRRSKLGIAGWFEALVPGGPERRPGPLVAGANRPLAGGLRARPTRRSRRRVRPGHSTRPGASRWTPACPGGDAGRR